jgi:hypothetical protein
MAFFYHFHQNNSGGVLLEPACEVFIEADTAEEANAIGLENGIYFDGVEKDYDCDCCGDRWYRASQHDALENDWEVMKRIEAYSWSAGRDVPHVVIIRKGA